VHCCEAVTGLGKRHSNLQASSSSSSKPLSYKEKETHSQFFSAGVMMSCWLVM
jgi:hypothetical protein